MAKRSALEILREDKASAARFAEKLSKERARKALERAQRELNERLKAIQASPLGDATFTGAQLRSTLEQVRAVLGPLTQSLKTDMIDLGTAAAEVAAASAAAYVQAGEDEFGLGRPLSLDTAALVDVAVSGTQASMARRIASDPNHPGKPGVLARYGLATMGKFEETLQQRLIQGKSWEGTKADIVTDSPFLQQAPAFWAERLLRTEAMHASAKGSFETIKQVEDIIGPMLKILVATFDDRTGSDSYAVHGQIRRTAEPFESWFGPYMHPPNRPNDREVVVPHNMSWPLPANLKPVSDGMVAARWAQEGRKGSPPGRPLMSTVNVEDIGKVQPMPLPEVPPEPPTPEPEQPPLPPPQPAQVLAPSPVAYSFAPPPPAAPEPLPPLPAAPLELPPQPLNILGTKVADASGSNPGGVYEGSDGVQRYVKFYEDKAQAAGEHLANKIYEALKLGSLDSQLFEHNGKVAYASKMIPKAKKLDPSGFGANLDPKNAKKALDGFAADVLLANWDAAGLTLDNMVQVPGGRVVRVDNGAALLSRAQGTRKPQHALDSPANEWSGFFDPKINPAYSKLAAAAGVSRPEDMAEQVVKGIERIDKLAKKGWRRFIDEHAPMLSLDDQDDIIAMLNTRTAFLRGKLPELRQQIKERNAPPALPGAPPKPIEEYEVGRAHEMYQAKADAAEDFVRAEFRRKTVVTAYTGSDYVDMNKLLYTSVDKMKEVGYSVPQIEAIQEQNRRLSETLKAAKAAGHAVEGVVYRGVAAWPGLMQEIESGEVGFKGHASCSTSQATSEGFINSSKGMPVMFRVRQKSGIPIDKVSANKGERELLLPGGSRFRVIDKKPWSHYGEPGRMIDIEEIE